MKTFITVSLDEKDWNEEKVLEKIEEHIHQTVEALLTMMVDKQLVQMKITNLPTRREET